jgi:transcriptional regulator with XRE-family HTH domain
VLLKLASEDRFDTVTEDSRTAMADDLATFLRQLRVAQNLTQKELADAAEISASYVGLIESGDRTPAPDVLERIAKALDVHHEPRRALFDLMVTPGSRQHGVHRAAVDASATSSSSSSEERDLLHTLLPEKIKSLAEAGSGPLVLAVRCPSGHANPTYLSACRVCSSRIKDNEPVPIPRPSLGRLVFSDGEALELTRGVILGRRPDRSYDDLREMPALFALASYQEISRIHAQVAINGWDVFVRDLGSTYGSSLTTPSGRRTELRPKQFYPLPPDAMVTLANTLQFVYEIGE